MGSLLCTNRSRKLTFSRATATRRYGRLSSPGFTPINLDPRHLYLLETIDQHHSEMHSIPSSYTSSLILKIFQTDLIPTTIGRCTRQPQTALQVHRPVQFNGPRDARGQGRRRDYLRFRHSLTHALTHSVTQSLSHSVSHSVTQ